MLKTLVLLAIALSLAPWCQAQDDVLLVDAAEQHPLLTALDRRYIVERLAHLNLGECQTRILRDRPRNVYRQLTLPHRGQPLHVSVTADVMRTLNMVIYIQSGDEWREFYDCPRDILLPALAIIATAQVDNSQTGQAVIGSNAIRQEVLARHSQLSSHEPSRLMMRTDSDDLKNTVEGWSGDMAFSAVNSESSNPA